MKTAVLIVALVFFNEYARAQSDSVKSYTTSRIIGDAPHIDGKADDPAWNQVEWGGGDFRQRNPNPGKPATVQTVFKILYDSRNLYVLCRNYDPEPALIISRMSRRDGFEGDFVEINIDSYFDKRTAFSFTASVSGVKGDEYVSNNGENWDASWDPIWYLKTSIDAEGWIAEMRIPLSQLRFADKPELTWGIQVSRQFFRKQELSNWQYMPPETPGWVHLFGELRGITGIRPQKQLEVQPYVLAKTERFAEEVGNPFKTGKSSGLDAGLDAKIGITSDITLDLTVNPDFGQVEADPSQVNLSAYELYFQERRPFFIEGNNILNFPLSDLNENNLFYSRRIGRQPQGFVDTDAHGEDDTPEYVKSRNRSTILGAAKLTGKNKHGFSWGLLESVTGTEYATIDSVGYRRKQAIEPLTNYFIARVQQDINKGNTLIGGMFTSMNRKIDDAQLDWLHSDAYSGGVDLLHNWHDRKFYVKAKGFMSYVQGSKEAILNTQMSSERFFQRPDNYHTEIDPNRTSLTGTGGTMMLGKRTGKIISDVGFAWTSPSLELNDVGFMAQTDNMTQWFWMQYRILNAVKKFRAQRYNINQWEEWDFGGRSTGRGYNANIHLEFKNYYEFHSGATYQVYSVSNADLRGGPAIRYPGYINYWIEASSDRRKKLQVTINPEWQMGFHGYSHNITLSADLVYKPINALNIAVSPSVGFNNNKLQYVATGSVNETNRFVVAEIDQTIVRMSVRATYMITPNLSVQYYGQPFGTSGNYSHYKNITDARAPLFQERYTEMSAENISTGGGMASVDEDHDGIADYKFNQPDFNFGQFRSNMVVRWEYIPGSTVFLVWTQELNGAFYNNNPGHRDYSFDFSEKAHNIFLIKYTYRFVL
jgi:hypothetical protein